jgi:hypothetical protein
MAATAKTFQKNPTRDKKNFRIRSDQFDIRAMIPGAVATPCASLCRWLFDNSLKFMVAALLLAPELFYFYRNTNSFRGTTEIGDVFKFVACLQ